MNKKWYKKLKVSIRKNFINDEMKDRRMKFIQFKIHNERERMSFKEIS
jgi:hypothetical protein